MSAACINPVLSFRSAVMQSAEMQEAILKAGSKTDFIKIASDHCYTCSLEDLCSFVNEICSNDSLVPFGPGTLPLRGDGTLPLQESDSIDGSQEVMGDGTLPLKTSLALLTLLGSLFHTLEMQEEQKPNASEAIDISRNWILPFWQIVGNG